MLAMNLRQHLTTVTRNAACCDEGRSVSYLYDLPLITRVNSSGYEVTPMRTLAPSHR